MPDRLIFGDEDDFEEPNPDNEPRPAADPEEDGADWADRPRSQLSKLPTPPPHFGVMPDDRDEALELEEELQLMADMGRERQAIKAGRPSQRARAAVRMDSLGFSHAEIARRLMFKSVGDAFEAITGTIGALVPAMDLKTARSRHSARLEMLLSAVMPRALNQQSLEHLAYSKQAGVLLQDLARLHGLNAPQQVQVSTPEAEEFNKVMAQVFAQRNPDMPKEIDVFDLEENDDGIFEEKTDADA